MVLLATTNEAGIAGLREQILANAVILYPNILIGWRGAKRLEDQVDHIPITETFQVVIFKEPISSANISRDQASDSVKPRYCAVLTYSSRQGPMQIMAGEANLTVAGTMGSLLDMLATVLYQGRTVLHVDYDKMFGQTEVETACDNAKVDV